MCRVVTPNSELAEDGLIGSVRKLVKVFKPSLKGVTYVTRWRLSLPRKKAVAPRACRSSTKALGTQVR